MEAAGKGSEVAQQREVKKDGNTGGNPKDCPVCLTSFGDTVQRPHALPCGHIFCTLCVNKLKEQGHVICPDCWISHDVPEGGQFPVCHTVEALIRRMRVTEAAASASQPPSARKEKGVARAADQEEAAGLSKIMRSFLQEQEARVVAAITSCQQVQSQLDQYQTTLTGWGEQQQQLVDTLQGLVDQNRSARELVPQEKSRAAAKKEEVKKREQQLHATLEMLLSLTTEQEAGVAATEVFRVTSEAKQVVEECQESFPDVDTVTTVRKAREASTAALEAFQAVQVALETHPTVTKEELRPQSDPDTTIMDRLQVILPPILKAEDLRSLTQPARSQLEAGRVFAVHQVGGQSRHAKISLEDGQLYLHALKEHLPLPGATILQVSEVVPPSPPCMVFLDLSWPGTPPQRFQVHLSRNTPGGRQFMLMCTGQLGPSYANTRLLKVESKGELGECLIGGKYESKDGEVAAALLPDLEGDYWMSGSLGAVHGWFDEPAIGTQFGITTKDWHGCGGYGGVFGDVVKGMHAVEAAAQHSNIAEVTVVDCGVVLWG